MSSESAALTRTPAPGLPPGTVIGRKYRIDEVVAEGGMGVVYKGWHLVLEHPIAIKVVRPEFAHLPEAAWRFVNEARVSAQLHGIHSAHVLDLGRIENGPPVMVLEYLEGFDLRQLLATEGPLSLSRAVDYVLQTCEAMAEAHANGIIHRDLKPENLFVARMPDGTEILKVIDFGISKRIGATGRSFTQQSLGSPEYMAPEQMSTPEQVDERADIWSIGVVLYELLTNSVPFRAETVQATCVKVMCEEPTPLRDRRPDLPPEFEGIVLRCLRKAVDERFPSIKELAQELVPFASAEHAQSSGRVRHILGSNDTSSTDSQSGMRVLSYFAPRPSDLTPLPPSIETEPELRVPMQPLWPIAMAVAAVALLVAFTISGPTSIRKVAASAVAQVGSVARTGARTMGDIAASAATYVENRARAVRESHDRSEERSMLEEESSVSTAPASDGKASGVPLPAPQATQPGAHMTAAGAPSRTPPGQESREPKKQGVGSPALQRSKALSTPARRGSAPDAARGVTPKLPASVSSQTIVPSESETPDPETPEDRSRERTPENPRIDTGT